MPRSRPDYPHVNRKPRTARYAAKAHRDANNLGPSIVKAFGKFTGGELLYWPDDNGHDNIEKLIRTSADKFDARRELVLFSGLRCHAVAPFEGERYSPLGANGVILCSRMLDDNLRRKLLIRLRCNVQVWSSSQSRSMSAPPRSTSTFWPRHAVSPGHRKRRFSTTLPCWRPAGMDPSRFVSFSGTVRNRLQFNLEGRAY